MKNAVLTILLVGALGVATINIDPPMIKNIDPPMIKNIDPPMIK